MPGLFKEYVQSLGGIANDNDAHHVAGCLSQARGWHPNQAPWWGLIATIGNSTLFFLMALCQEKHQHIVAGNDTVSAEFTVSNLTL
jgi:hypothetical protein